MSEPVGGGDREIESEPQAGLREGRRYSDSGPKVSLYDIVALNVGAMGYTAGEEFQVVSLRRDGLLVQPLRAPTPSHPVVLKPSSLVLRERRACVAAVPFDPVVIPEHARGAGQKATNPKDALAGTKPRWFSYLPVRVLLSVGVAMYEGARKYGRHNYRPAGVRASVYMDAVTEGHLTPWWEGEDIDPDSGLSHIDKAIASLMVLRDSMLQGNWVDDRPPRAENFAAHRAEMTKVWAEIQARHPDPQEPWTQRRIDGSKE